MTCKTLNRIQRVGLPGFSALLLMVVFYAQSAYSQDKEAEVRRRVLEQEEKKIKNERKAMDQHIRRQKEMIQEINALHSPWENDGRVPRP